MGFLDKCFSFFGHFQASTTQNSHDFVALATEETADDWVMLHHDTPSEENADSALAAKEDLRQRGYVLKHLGAERLRSQKGIYIYALMKEDTNEPINIVCRGSAADASIVADLDPMGPGYQAVQAERELLMQQINALAAQYLARKIRVVGHSLGGAVAQILATAILEERVNACVGKNSPMSSALINLQGLDIVLFQSACVHPEFAKLADDRAQHIKMLDPQFSIHLVAHVKQGDFISRTGSYIFSEIDPEIANVYLDFRSLDKPWMSLSDALEVGFVACTTGGTLIPTMVSAASIISSRYIENRAAAHTDFFYHDPEDRTFSTILPRKYGYFSNAVSQQRSRIGHIFNKNDLQYIPLHHQVHQTVYELVEPLNNAEVKAIKGCVSAATQLISASSKVALSASQGIIPLVVSTAKHAAKISHGLQTVSEYLPEARGAYNKII